MRTARPKWLVRSRRWGAWVPGGVVERDMLICVRTRSGKSWFSKVKEVLDQRATGAICERIDIVEEKLMTQEIPFLDHDYLDGDLDHLAPKRICHEQVLDTIAKAFRPASAIENYEYYEDYKWNCAFYQTVLDQVIQIVSSQILEMTDGQNGEGELQLGASGVDREAQRSVLTPVPTAMDKSETHCLQCGRQRNDCVCNRGSTREKIVIDKYGIVHLEKSCDWHH